MPTKKGQARHLKPPQDGKYVLRLYVSDGDAVYQQALAAGATAVTEMTSLAFGDRVGRVRDPFGNLWWIQTRLENLDLDQLAADKVYEFAFIFAPLRLKGATGSPGNPIAVR